jgi:hypothetical protein
MNNMAEHVLFYKTQAKAFAIIEHDKLDYVAEQITLQISFDET